MTTPVSGIETCGVCFGDDRFCKWKEGQCGMDKSLETEARVKQNLILECEVGKGCHKATCQACTETIKEMSEKEHKRVIDLSMVKVWKCEKCGIRVAKGQQDLTVDTCKLKGRGCGLEQLIEMVSRLEEKQKGAGPKVPAILKPQVQMPTDRCPLKKPCFSGGCGSCRNEVLRQNGQAVVETTKQSLAPPPPAEYEVEVDNPMRIRIDKKGNLTYESGSE